MQVFAAVAHVAARARGVKLKLLLGQGVVAFFARDVRGKRFSGDGFSHEFCDKSGFKI